LTLAKQLGAVVFTYKGEDIADTLLRFAKEYRVGNIVIGRPIPKPFWKRFGKNRNIVKNLINNARGISVIVLDTREEEALASRPPLEMSEEKAPTLAPSQPWSHPQGLLMLSRLLSPRRIVIWDQPVAKDSLLRRLVEKVGQGERVWDSARFLNAILEREQQGSTFFNEGAAFPHARIDGLTNSIVSLGLTRQGVSDEPTEKPIEIVFLIFSPAQNPDEQIKILALASRAAQSRHLRQRFQLCRTSEEVMAVVRNWDWEEEQKPLPPFWG
jgi:two-component system sensor histidine kinase KdpD